jgi:inorganic pyrophosphatase
MDISKIAIGNNPPTDVNVIIEIPLRGDPVKYEICKESGAMFVDRFLHTAMYYPANYGFIPHTLSADGDPVDVMVLGRVPVAVGCVMRSRPIGVMLMEDEGGIDEKILAVPHPKLHPFYDEVKTYEDLPDILIRQIEHFFVHYKDLEPGKWVELRGWGGPNKAAEIIEQAIAAAKKKKKKK